MAEDIREKLEKKGERQTRLETPEHLGATGEVDQQGTAGHTPSGKVGKRDEEKMAFETPSGATRVRKGDTANPSEDEG